MDESSLRRLAVGGLGDFPPAKLGDLAAWCEEYCWATGHVAYCVLSNLFSVLFEAWSHPIPVDVEEGMSGKLRAELPAVLDSDYETSRIVALALREDVLLILSS